MRPPRLIAEASVVRCLSSCSERLAHFAARRSNASRRTCLPAAAAQRVEGGLSKQERRAVKDVGRVESDPPPLLGFNLGT